MKQYIKEHKKNIIIFLIPFLIFMLMLLVYYPGIVPYDGNNQWQQVQSGVINNGHPFFSTYFMYLLSKIVNHHIIVLLFQITIFSLFWMIMCHKTRTENNYKKQIIYTIFISLIPIISLYAITLWKDILYSYYLMMLGFMTYDISKKDFKNIKNYEFIIIGLLSFLVFSYRHNGMLVAILYMIIFVIIYVVKNKRDFKKIFIFILTFILLFGIVSIPKKIYLDKSNSLNTQESISTIDMYMTWIYGKYIKEDVVSKKDLKFLNNVIDIKYWKTVYNDYLINDTFMPDKVDEEFINKHSKQYRDTFIKYSLKYPNLLVDHYLKADALLIDINSMDEGYLYSFPFENWEYLSFEQLVYSKIPILERIYTKGINVSFMTPFKYFYQPGLILYICIILAIYIAKRFKDKKIWYLLITMFLNTLSLLPTNVAQDLRYVYINYLILLILGLVLIEKHSLKKLKS